MYYNAYICYSMFVMFRFKTIEMYVQLLTSPSNAWVALRIS